MPLPALLASVRRAAPVLLAAALALQCSRSGLEVGEARTDAGPALSCGDGVIDRPGEQCDGADLGGATCSSVLGEAASGTVSCSPDCKLVPSCEPLGCPTPGLQAGAPWPTQSQCSSHWARSLAVGSQHGEVAWSIDDPNAQWGAPAVGADGTIYAVHNASAEPGAELTAIDATGAMKWAAPVGAVPDGAPSIGADGTVYVAWQSPVYAIAPDGSTKWATSDDASHFGATIGPDGTVYTGGDSGEVSALSPADGSTLWSMPTGDDLAWPPAVGSDGTIYVSSVHDQVPFSSHINALESDGSVAWQIATDKRFLTSPLVDANGRVYVGTEPYVQAPMLVGELVAIDPPGVIAWTFTTGQVFASPSLGQDGTVYVASENGLWALRPDGTLRWHAAPGVQIRGSPAIGADGTAYLGSVDGSIFAVTAAGAPLWTFSGATGTVLSPAIGADGTVYAGGAERFFAFAP